MAGKKKIDLNNLTPDEVLKYEIAGELGLLDRVLENGWRTLTAKETGRIGGLVTRRKERDGEPGRNRCRFRNTSGKK
ncbi:MAG: small, acid-soluble spore protein, alpha/beta type [Lacrimispora saccharolytica]